MWTDFIHSYTSVTAVTAVPLSPPPNGSVHRNPLAAALSSLSPFCHPLYSLLFQTNEHAEKGLHSTAESYSNMAGLRFSINQGPAPYPFLLSVFAAS